MCAARLRVYATRFFSVAVLVSQGWSQQQMSDLDRDRAQIMLQVVANEVRKNYYDPRLHGLDWDAKVAEAREKIGKTTSMNMALSHIAAALDTLNDSHTFFLPPEHSSRFDYGWQYQMFGERCFVTRVRPKSDAEAKGVRPGDEIITLNGYGPNRDNLWKMQYVFSVLRPQSMLHLTLRDPSGVERKVDLAAKIRERRLVTDLTGRDAPADVWDFLREGENARHLMRARSAEFGDQLMILKVPEFSFSATEIEDMISKARKHSALIVDLRGDPGGSVDTLKYLVSGMFDKDLKIADRVGRKEAKAEIAKASHHEFSGKLAVLVDATSASAAELFARIMQIEKRGLVVGDHTSGSVMEARHYNERMGSDTMIFYGASITEWDLIIADGKSLEHTGVIPDEIALPSAKDLASGRDPVMSRAAELLGAKLTPEEAGKLFPYEWPAE
jgi:carboxyl-terminal processing protease